MAGVGVGDQGQDQGFDLLTTELISPDLKQDGESNLSEH